MTTNSTTQLNQLVPVRAVILTGARKANLPLLEGTDLSSKVLLSVGGRPMVVSVFDAIYGSDYKPEMYVSTDAPEIQNMSMSAEFTVLPIGKTAVSSLVGSIEAVPGDGWVLLVSGDHPLLTSEMVTHFISEVIERDLAFGVGVVNKRLVDQYYPDTVRTYFPVKNGAYSGGNLYLVNKKRFMKNVHFFETLDKNRKKPWKSAVLMDPWTIIQLAFRQLDMHEIASRASKVIGCETGIVDMPFPECCMDVDKPSDKVIAERILADRAKATAPESSDVLQPSI